jgi:hypothetical protein
MGNVSPLELVWLLVNTVTLVFVIGGLFDARADRVAVRLLNGKAREIAASGNVRRELLRLVKVLLLLVVAVPGLFFADGEVRPPFFRVLPAVALMAIAVLLLGQSFIDGRERKRLIILVAADASAVKVETLDRIEAKIDANTDVSQGARDDAHVAAEVANHLNERMAAQDRQILAQGEDAAAASADLKGTVETTAEQVSDLHEGTAPEGAT